MAAAGERNKKEKRFERDELVFDGIIAKVHKVHLAMGDGQLVQRDYIHYPGAAIVLPVLADGSIALIRNWRFAVQEQLCELPAGVLEEGEAPAACAARELTEETGYTAGKLEKLGGFYTGPGTSDEFIHAYLATELTDGRQALEHYEEITVEVRRDDQVRRMVTDGTIRDAKTISALALYWLRSKSKNI
jgi:ADP-ribose pyrophosphatase